MNNGTPQTQEAALLARAKGVFLDAVELGLVERNAYVDSRCDGDEALRKLVMELLVGECEPLPIESLADDIRAAATETLYVGNLTPPGSMIGRYRLIERIGEGGFGVVFAAEQITPVKRPVALKLIKLGMDTRQVVARFEAERQALAMMEHPSIAKVFDAGATETGRPYFVMELIKGLPITEYCDSRALRVRERLELFMQVCDAVQHAHNRGIIHRDLKPSNVLVTESGSKALPKVIDFGIAKATGGTLTDKTVYTQLRQMIGTPEYMSPEQANVSSTDIDTRTDVYSLGVVLYVLLTGVTPFDVTRLRSASIGEVQRIISEEDPPRPSTRLSRHRKTESSDSAAANIATKRSADFGKLFSLLRGDLDWIVMKALEKDRERRYESAAALSLDVARYLAGDAVMAAPPSKIYQGRKFVRRNWVMVSALTMVAAALLVGTVGFAWQARVARVQRDEAVKARARAETTNQFVITLLQSGDPNAQGAGESTTIVQAMQKAIEDLNSGRFSDDLATDAALRMTIAGVLAYYTRTEDAAPLYEQALDALRRHHQGDHLEVAQALSHVAYMRYAQLRNEEASVLALQAVEMLQRLDAGDCKETVFALNVLALVQPTDKLAETLALMKQALEVNQRVHPGDHPQTVSLMWNVGTGEVEANQPLRGEELLQRALDMSRRLRPEQPLLVSHSAGFLAYAKRALGKYAQAEESVLESLEIYEGIVKQPTWDWAAKVRNVALAKLEVGKPAEAEMYSTRALEYLAERQEPLTTLVLTDRARSRQLLGRPDEARSDFDRGIAILRNRAGPDGGGPGLAEVLYRSALVHMENQNLAAALAELEDADAIAVRTFSPERSMRIQIREALLACRAALAASQAK